MTMMQQGRHVSIDAVRGFAVLGILLMNIVGMGLPSFAYMNPSHAGGDSGLNLVAWMLNFVFVDGKMRGLFTLLYGVSLLLISDGAEGRTPGPVATHYRRTFWLFVIGMIHGWFIWFGDILVAYSLAGAMAFLARKQSAKRLAVAGGVILAVVLLWQVGGYFALSQMQAAAALPGADPALVAEWQATWAQLAPTAAAAKAEIAGYRGSYADVFATRMPLIIFFQTYLGPTYFIWEALGFMLIGMALYRTGFFTGELPRTFYNNMIGLIPLGAILSWFLADMLIDSKWDPVLVLLTDGLGIPVHLAMAIGYATVVVAMVRGHRLQPVVARLSACGHMALTNYLGASVIATTIFYGYGLGLYGHLERAQLYVVVVGIWALQLLCSPLWLARFRYGPVEWVWRSLARWEVQRFRR